MIHGEKACNRVKPILVTGVVQLRDGSGQKKFVVEKEEEQVAKKTLDDE